MIYVIFSDVLSVSVSDAGAEIVSVLYRGKERSWQNENGTWAKHSPVLFPVCGNSQVILGGKNYNMSFHGFARNSVFTCVKKTDDSAVFKLTYSEDTLLIYPFRFEYSIGYFIEGDTIRIENTVINVGDRDMPFALGRHDSFSLSGDVSDYELVFSESETFISQKTAQNGKLINAFDDFGSGKILPLPADFLSDGRTVILKNVLSESVLLRSKKGEKKAEYFFGDIKNILLWRPQGANMICIEPWSSLPDDDGDTREFGKGKEYFILPCGESKKIDFAIKYY